MYNEFLRFIYNKKRYGFDSFSDGLYLVIFLCGTLLILKGNPEVNLFLYLLFFAFTNMIVLANEELEYEIRTDQIKYLELSSQGVFQVYAKRAVIYFTYSALLFLLCAAFISPVSIPVQLGSLWIALFCGILFFALYQLVIWLTIRYQRISVVVDFFYTILLFYSGMVFPLKHGFSFGQFLVQTFLS